jgi:hypothetical protein
MLTSTDIALLKELTSSVTIQRSINIAPLTGSGARVQGSASIRITVA